MGSVIKLHPTRARQIRPTEQLDAESMLQSYAYARYQSILEQREEILEAFIAKFGCQPDEIVQVIQRVDSQTEIFYVTKKEPNEIPDPDLTP